ncbi:MAG: pitrilysin family protein [Patescibacteria group bacterium]|nr:pitrilysin family protein [Patescibacteria group bacterium]
MSFKYKKKVLDSGLTVITVPMAAESVTVLLLVKVGSRNEQPSVNGISHFLEHMVFKGTDKWSEPTDVNKVIESVGGVVNAFTGREYTGFWVKIPKKYLKLGLEFVHQLVFKSLIPGLELEKERGVILEEIKMYQDNPMAQVVRKYMGQVYQGTVLEQSVLGPAKNIKKIKRQDFFDHLKKWYVPTNMVLAVAGGGSDKTVALAEQIFINKADSKIKFQDKLDKKSNQQQETQVQLIKKPIQQAHFCLGLPTFERRNKQRYALGILNTVLGANMSSRLFEQVREKRGLVYYIKSSTNSFLDRGDLVVQAGCDANRVDEAIMVVRQELGKLKQQASQITEEELVRAKQYVKGMLALSLENSKIVAKMIGRSLLLENKVRDVEEIRTKIDQVSQQDVAKVAKQIIKDHKLNLTVLGDFDDQNRFEKLVI